MRFVLKWSYACAKQLAAVLNENHNRKAVYYYGFYIVFGSLVKGIILISISLLLGILIPALLIVAVFGSLRMLAGGFHFDTFGRCLFISLGLFLAVALISQYTYQYWNSISVVIFLILVFAISLYVLKKYAPRDTPTKPITDPLEIMKFKKLSIVYMCIWLIVCSILIVLNLNMYVIAMSFGVLLEIFSVTPVGHVFFNKIKTGLNNKSNIRTLSKNKNK
ncbi:MAG: accessory gene regulator ArgB-like protein [Ruminiclostridium sp.]